MKKKVFKVEFFLMFMLVFIVGFFGFTSASLTGSFHEELLDVDNAPFDVGVIINVAPLIVNLDPLILVCENTQLSAPESAFQVTDVNANVQVVSLDPLDPFFIGFLSPLNQVIVNAEIVSTLLTKDDVKQWSLTVFASDGTFQDSKDTVIDVIEVNNEPNITDIGVQTKVWTLGDDSTFFHQVQVTDVEDGNQDSGTLIFDLIFLDGPPQLFDITQSGVMDFTPMESDIGVYNLSVCVTDLPLAVIHPDISICGQDGSPIEACSNFSLTITDENRAPIITTNFPLELEFNASGSETIYFNISDRDPDGTIPDTYWYVDDVIIEYDPASLVDEFFYSFGCGVSGNHTVMANSTDGLLSDSVEWNVSVEGVSCPVPPSSSGGGGGSFCSEKWGCLEWNTCQSTDLSFDLDILPVERFADITVACDESLVPGENCGFQLRNCLDVNTCGSVNVKPEEIGQCFFIENPSCSDGVSNCHDGFCEILVDCGGECGACASCSDGIKNQGERKVDCGGPCPFDCPTTLSFIKKIRVQYILITLISLLLVFMAIKIIRMYRAKKRVKEKIMMYPSRGRAIYED